MSTIEVPEYFTELLKQTISDASLLLAGIFIILILVYLVDIACRWYEIGQRYHK